MASNSSKLSAPEIYEIQQYEKVVTFAESIASRIHPGIKMPTEVKVAPLVSGLCLPSLIPEVDIVFCRKGTT